MRYVIPGILLVISVGVTTGWAQESQPIGLSDAIDIALENNFQLQVAKNNQQLENLNVRGAKAGFLPSISSGFGASRNIGRQFNELTGEVGNFTSDGMNGSISAGLDLFTGFQQVNELKSARRSAQAQQNKMDRERQTIIFETVSQYLDLMRKQELLRIDRRNLEISQQLLNRTKQMVDAGTKSVEDLYDQQTTVANNKMAVTEAENAVRLSRLKLVRTLQLNPDKQYTFKTPDLTGDSVRVAPKKYDLDQLIEQAKQHRGDIKQHQLTAEASKYQVEAIKGSQYPSVSLSTYLGSGYNDRRREPIIDPETNQVIGTEPVGFSEQFFNRNIRRSIGLNVSIPIFRNLQNDIQLARQKINRKNARLQLQDQRMQVIQEVTEAYNEYEAIIQRLENTRQILKVAQLAYQTRRESYLGGGTNFTEINQANQRYISALDNRVQTVYDYLVQMKRLDYQVGNLEFEMTLEGLINFTGN